MDNGGYVTTRNPKGHNAKQYDYEYEGKFFF